ncbi:hypothetical protein O1611_g884 [Lasiodiplodia mahajangana]|uniref:Uncharacterized protein n=1 Tax=Lasiodiplodia mahajangana TaxID=1108764 RepID=A0ACC2JZF7_9PEZI|nr:hypothetical protein O1611_g884 [Lasiodiplodia mahajangana]
MPFEGRWNADSGSTVNTEMMDDNELWMSGDEAGNDAPSFLTRNRPGQKQREVVTSRGDKRRSRFYVSCIAKAIIHGTMDTTSCMPATLLVYDFEFSPLRSGTRIKEVVIVFEFRPKKGGSKAGPKVVAIQPSGTHSMLETTEPTNTKFSVDFTANFGNVGLKIGPKIGGEWNTSRVKKYATTVTGAMPADDWGHRYQARWSLFENESQHSGVPTLFRVVILLERGKQECEGEFLCVPYIEAKVDFKTTLLTLFSSNTPDHPIEFSDEYEPFNELEGYEINPQGLASVSLEKLWDCTFHNSFEHSVKSSGGAEVDAEEAPTAEVELQTADGEGLPSH